jgi:hypothetical protein
MVIGDRDGLFKPNSPLAIHYNAGRGYPKTAEE